MKSNYCAQRKEEDKRDKSRKRQLTINEKKEEKDERGWRDMYGSRIEVNLLETWTYLKLLII